MVEQPAACRSDHTDRSGMALPDVLGSGAAAPNSGYASAFAPLRQSPLRSETWPVLLLHACFDQIEV